MIKRYHYVYRITNIKDRMHYYGTRTSKVYPKDDIGIIYFSSSYDKDFINDQKENPQHYKYKVLKVFSTREKALELEIMLHKKFDVKTHKQFYNDANQTSTGFDTTDKVTVLDTRDNKIKSVSKKDYDKYDYYVGSTTGYVTVLDTRDNKIKSVSKKDYDKYDYYVGSTTGMTPAIDKDGNKYYVSKDDRRIKSGELFHPSKLLKTINNGETSKRVAPELVDKYLENGWVLGTLVTKPNFSIGTKFMNKDGKRKRVHLDKIEEAKLDGWELGLPKFICPYCNKKGAGSSMHLYHFENCKEKV